MRVCCNYTKISLEIPITERTWIAESHTDIRETMSDVVHRIQIQAFDVLIHFTGPLMYVLVH